MTRMTQEQRVSYTLAVMDLYWRTQGELEATQKEIRELDKDLVRLFSARREHEQRQEQMPFFWRMRAGEFEGSPFCAVAETPPEWYDSALDGWTPQLPMTHTMQRIDCAIAEAQEKLLGETRKARELSQRLFSISRELDSLLQR